LVASLERSTAGAAQLVPSPRVETGRSVRHALHAPPVHLAQAVWSSAGGSTLRRCALQAQVRAWT
jgi:hypothetical protein